MGDDPQALTRKSGQGEWLPRTRAFSVRSDNLTRRGVTAGFIATMTMLFPTGDGQGKMIAEKQPVTLAAMEGLFETTEGAPLALVGQPDTDRMKLDNPLLIPRALSFLTYRRWGARVQLAART